MTEATLTKTRLPIWLLITAVLGTAWNAFGLFQLMSSINQTEAGLMMQGMSAEAAATYYNLPVWMDLAFAVGAGGGVLACIALLARNATAVPVALASLIGYIILFAGDYAYGLFALIPAQLAILSTVVAIAIVLFGISLLAKARAIIT
ncbi:hypothetical protein [Blastomonas aquatica]|uniref:Sugar transporter n=1 Tax=Blastomonas aquatica TaxID=1510276 RepID=A0ABQ1JLG3_9SPHN|nr:hypothetical protein [Blastomonas aquatica]GGB71967.1 hypothetical protein GCM10010833_28960 [Blastomonas aquatica]